MADGTPVGEPLTGHEGEVFAVAAGALPDGTPVIISAAGTARCGYGGPPTAPRSGTRCAAIMARYQRWRWGGVPDGTPVIISGGRDGTVRVWRTADGTPVVSPLHLPESIQAVALHDDIIITAAGADIAVHQPALL